MNPAVAGENRSLPPGEGQGEHAPALPIVK
jgi:hypothetical protein